jgi:predicted ATP-dependent endonuclease of OLD family
MAIQARHFHSQWVMTTENRPLCLMIFIEEPEVHLHAQVQQTFISNIWQVINQSAEVAGEPNLVPQLVITTHSSHIMEAVDFEKVRYFQRCQCEGETEAAGIRNASMVRSLRAFQPNVETIDGKVIPPSESLAFLKRYLRLTHCDLFFADAGILVEGAVEKLLMPTMIERAAERLRTVYLTVLEVGERMLTVSRVCLASFIFPILLSQTLIQFHLPVIPKPVERMLLEQKRPTRP